MSKKVRSLYDHLTELDCSTNKLTEYYSFAIMLGAYPQIPTIKVNTRAGRELAEAYDLANWCLNRNAVCYKED